jgi:CRP-like cAMP-binding protein
MMVRSRLSRLASPPAPAFDVSGAGGILREYRRGESVFRQGDRTSDIFYVKRGGVQLSTQSTAGRQAKVGLLGPGDFFGEGCLTGQRARTGTATAVTPCVILRISRRKITKLLQQRVMADRFMAHLLSRLVRMEEDLAEYFTLGPTRGVL